MHQLYPILLSLFPIHTIYGENFREISLRNYICAAPIITFFTIGGILGINRFTDNIYLADILFTVNFFALIYAKFVYMGILSKYKRGQLKYQIGFIFTYLLACSGVSFCVIKLAQILPLVSISKFLFYASLVITLFVGADIIEKLSTKPTKENIDFKQKTNKAGDCPNIYHILADAHSGFAINSVCDELFKTELKKRGFTIYENAKSNYTQTNWSVPSMFCMNYIQNLIDGEGENKNIYPTFKTLAKYGNNQTFKFLKSSNYELFFSVTRLFNHLVRGLSTKKRFELNSNKIISTLISGSILAIHPFFLGKRGQEKHLFNVINKFKELAIQPSNSPKYCFTHFLAPHRPYLFDENGKRLSQNEISNEKNYFSYQKYINKQIIKLIDDISGKIPSNSIIILHGDHANGGDITQLHNILLAVKFPKQYNPDCIKQDISLVNLFPSIFNEIFKTSFPQKENRYYICSGNEIHDIKAIQTQDANLSERAKLNDFRGQLRKLERKYRNKKIVLYGAGIFLETLKKNYDLSRLNIIAIADSKFEGFSTPSFDNKLGYNRISPYSIKDLNPDIVLISTLNIYNIERYFNESLFKNMKYKFKYEPLLKVKLKTIIEEEFI